MSATLTDTEATMDNQALEEKVRQIITRATSAQWPMLKKQEKQVALVAIEKEARELLIMLTRPQ
jgi:hypothetical protein